MTNFCIEAGSWHHPWMDIRQILIIADDLSGAADCALGCMLSGMDARVLLEQPGSKRHPDAVAVQTVAIDADSRRMAAADAMRTQQAILRRYRRPAQLLYKKIDSTLRGNIGAELLPLIADAGMAIIAPAFPQARRTTRGGRQYLNDAPLEQDPLWSAHGLAGSADIRALLREQRLDCVPVPLDQVRMATADLQRLLHGHAHRQAPAVICDAETDDDLRRIALASLELAADAFWVGSAGLSRQLAAATGLGRHAVAAAPVRINGPIVTLVGSFADTSCRQSERLRMARPVAAFNAPAPILRDGPAHPGWQALQERVRQAVCDGADLLLGIDAGETVEAGGSPDLCRSLVALLAPRARSVGALILTGGESARAALTALGLDSLRPIAEIEAGIPLSLAGGAALPVITKAGAFGMDDTLLRCYDRLCQSRAAYRNEHGSSQE